jgi:AraC-like DNA-binding protein
MLTAFQYKKNDYNSIPLLLGLIGSAHNQEPVYRVHGVPIYQLFFCKDGEGELLLDNRRFIIRKNQCFLILKDTPHEYRSLSKDWFLDIVGFNGSIVPLLLRSLKLNTSGAFKVKDLDIIKQHHQTLVKLAKNADSDKYMLLSQHLYCLLTDLSKNISYVTSSKADYGNPTITQVIGYLEANYFDDISLDNLAEQVQRTPEYLCNVFKKNTGVTIVKYLNNIRLLHAMTMLVEEPSTPVNKIAQACGFRSPSYFGRVFTQHYGVSPNQYRMEHIL